jgi:hypothetical protein
MKTLKWSAIALFFLCIFSSCTKSADSDSQQLASANRIGNPVGNASSDIEPGLMVSFNPSPAVENQTVTVTGTFDGSTAIPNCGKLELEQKQNNDWVPVGVQVNVTSTTHEVTYQFTPTLVGDDVYEFRLHYIVAGCDGYNNAFSGSYFLDVLPACQGLTLTGHVASAVSQGDGNYLFTVEYTVSTCTVRYDYLKLQGGLTAFSTEVEAISPDDASLKEAGNSSHPNTIVKWEETAQLQGNTKTYSVSFKKAWSGSGPVELTGQWSVHATLNGTETGLATFPPIIHQ